MCPSGARAMAIPSFAASRRGVVTSTYVAILDRGHADNRISRGDSFFGNISKYTIRDSINLLSLFISEAAVAMRLRIPFSNVQFYSGSHATKIHLPWLLIHDSYHASVLHRRGRFVYSGSFFSASLRSRFALGELRGVYYNLLRDTTFFDRLL